MGRIVGFFEPNPMTSKNAQPGSENPSTKRIVIDMSSAKNRYIGVGEFCHQLALRFADRAETMRRKYGIEFCFIVPRKLKNAYGNQVDYLVLREFPQRWLIKFRTQQIDLFHAMHQFAAVKYMSSARSNLMTVHDINFMTEKHGQTRTKYIIGFRRKLNQPSHINFISQFTERDVLEHFKVNQPYRVIYNGVTDLRGTTDVDISRWNLPADFLFHISSLQPKKNPALLVEMMRMLPDKNLVIVGNWSTAYGMRIKHRIKELELTNVIPLDPVTNEEKAALYARCEGFLFPSLCEGFGLPPLEAMLMGKPVFLSNLSSLPEVGGPVAYYWDELQPDKMAERVRHGLDEFYAAAETNAQRCVDWASQFNWDRCADEYIDYYREILGL